MKLNRRQEGNYDKKPEQDKEVNRKSVRVDWRIYMENKDALIPYGKHINRTLEWVKTHETDYYHWIKENNLMGDWGLVMLREENEEEKKPYSHFVASDGSIWICLIEKQL